jgi:hypothetical protein
MSVPPQVGSEPGTMASNSISRVKDDTTTARYASWRSRTKDGSKTDLDLRLHARCSFMTRGSSPADRGSKTRRPPTHFGNPLAGWLGLVLRFLRLRFMASHAPLWRCRLMMPCKSSPSLPIEHWGPHWRLCKLGLGPTHSASRGAFFREILWTPVPSRSSRRRDVHSRRRAKTLQNADN